MAEEQAKRLEEEGIRLIRKYHTPGDPVQTAERYLKGALDCKPDLMWEAGGIFTVLMTSAGPWNEAQWKEVGKYFQDVEDFLEKNCKCLASFVPIPEKAVIVGQD